MVLSAGERIKGFLFSPSKTFDNSKEDMIGDALKYFAIAIPLIIYNFSSFLFLWRIPRALFIGL